MIPSYLKRYLIEALEGSPTVLAALVSDLSGDSPLWDVRPDPDRFTLREVLAHLADWEPVCRGRIIRTRTEEKPLLPNWDEDQAAIIGDYAHTRPYEALLWFTERRADTIALLRSLSDEDWHRVADRENVGLLSIYTQITLILAHDGYHARQIAEYLKVIA